MDNNENEFQNNSGAGNENDYTQQPDPFAQESGNAQSSDPFATGNGSVRSDDPFAKYDNGYTQAPNYNNVNGQSQGNPYGNPQGNPYGQPQGNMYGNPQGNPYGQPQGNMYGQPQGNMYGNPYGQPQPGQEGGQGLAIASLVLGILSLVCCCTVYPSLIMGIVSFVLSLVVLIQKKPGKGMAIAGLICSGIAIVLLIIILIFSFSIDEYQLQRFQQEILEELQDAQY